MKKWLKRNIKDKRLLVILFKFLDVFVEGLALGYYISQWLANYLLQPLDHYIKERIFLNENGQPENRDKRVGVTHMMRYMDDIVLFGANKKQLHTAVARIRVFLNECLGLQLKSNWQVFRFDYIDKSGIRRGRPLDYMGFVFYREKTVLRKSIMLRATRKAARIGRKPKVTAHDASAMLSYMGWISHTDTYKMYETRIKTNVAIARLKKIVSLKSRRNAICGKKKHLQHDKRKLISHQVQTLSLNAEIL